MSWAERPLGYAGPIRLDPRDLHRIAEALERIADCLDDVNHDGQVAVKGLVVTREDRP